MVNRTDLLLSLLAGAFLGLSWLFPGEPTGALLGWLSGLCFVIAALTTSAPLLFLYFAGALSHCIAFYWITHTVSLFGGFGPIPTGLIFALFVGISALQFPLFGFIARAIDSDTKRYALTTPLAWCTLEYLVFRIFPWQFGHSQLAFTPFVQIADIGGSILISFMLFWVLEAGVRFFLLNQRSKILAVPLLIFVCCISYGRYRVYQFSEMETFKQKVAVIQANVSIEDKHNVALVQTNVERYRTLSAKIPGPDTLIIWPESVMTEFISDEVGSVGNDPRLPFFESNNPLLIGALTFRSRDKLYNSALGILNTGTVLDPYHKQILMPFGEYMPMSGLFPWLLDLNPNIANFSEGTESKVFVYLMQHADGSFYEMRVSPLICYEDVVSSLSRNAVKNGAELLVNLTNDAWFGDSVAPLQHNLIASFRAIENRRFLIRSTNTGLTAIVNPLGQTVAKLKPFSEGTLLAEVGLMGYTSLYTDFVGDRFAWVVVLFTLTFTVYHFVLRKV